MANTLSISERADALEHAKIDELGSIVSKSFLFNLADGKMGIDGGRELLQQYPGKRMLMGDDPRLPKMPARPTLLDFFKYRMSTGGAYHMLQSATHALKAGMNEKTILACLLHDFAVSAFIRCDHGYWGAQLVAPYVDEEVSWAIKMHQALRFYPDEAAGYAYPQNYIDYFGADYEPDDYVQADYERARNHKWYMTARMITVHDIYSFDPNAKVSMDDFVDIVGRNFRQPEEGLGYDDSPVAHMWRTLIRPTKFL